jgi:5-formyltetrahydrofolate cyclo-ligase
LETQQLKKRLRSKIRSVIGRSFADESGRSHKDAADRKLVGHLDAWLDLMRRNGHQGFWAFWPTLPEEPDFRNWLTGCMGKGLTIGLPRLNWESRSLEFRIVTDPSLDLVFDTRGLAEPKPDLPSFEPNRVTLILVPGLAFDRSGRRLGRGAGFYDRTLARVSAGVPKIGLCYDEQVVDEVPTESWDLCVDHLLTPGTGLRHCRADV